MSWGKFPSTNQKHYPDLGSEHNRFAITVVITQSFHGKLVVASQNGSSFSTIYKFIIIIIIIIFLFIIIVYYSSRSVIFLRPVENIRGFSRETVIEVTTNIESQERRIKAAQRRIGFCRTPSSCRHRWLGNVLQHYT